MFRGSRLLVFFQETIAPTTKILAHVRSAKRVGSDCRELFPQQEQQKKKDSVRMVGSFRPRVRH